MSEKRDDPAVFKAQQREQWSNVAEGWKKRWAAYEQGAQPLSDRMMDLAHVALGQCILDVATGIGEPAMTVARRIGPRGRVTAIDQAPQMLAVARERMREAGIQTVDFIEGDAEAISLPPDAFDAVVCRWGLQFFHDPVSALARFRGTLVPGGRLVAAIWGPPEQVPIISLPFTALGGEVGQPQALPRGPNPFALSDPTKLEQVLHNAGLAEVESERFTVTFTFVSIGDFLGHLAEVSAPIHMIMAASSSERQAEFWKKLAAAAVPFTRDDGAVQLANGCLIASGRRAAGTARG